jgi:phosphomannomutase
MTLKSNLKVSVSGVRGVVGESLTPSLIADFAASFGEYVGQGRVIVGRDTRPTGRMVEDAVIAGLLAVGCQPALIGVSPTPTVQILVDEYHANGGIAITASHNSVEWNALKFIGPSGIFLNYTEAEELLDVYNQPDTTYIREQDYRNMRFIDNAFDLHKERIFNSINLEAVRAAKFKVAVDCCNGVGAVYSRAFLEELGCAVVSVFDEPDGMFRRTPEPVASNLEVLGKAVKDNSCVIGFAQDPDGDRIAVVRGDGRPAGEQYSIVLAAEHVLASEPGNVVANIQTTKALEHVVKSYNCNLAYSKVGEINVTSRMFAENAVIGGEGSSGGVIWPKVHSCRDSFTAMALILEMMALRSERVDQILDKLPRYYSNNMKFKCSAVKAHGAVRALSSKYADKDIWALDGLRIDFKNSWILIRPSNTEPVIRMMAEAETPEDAEKLTNRFAEEISTLI